LRRFANTRQARAISNDGRTFSGLVNTAMARVTVALLIRRGVKDYSKLIGSVVALNPARALRNAKAGRLSRRLGKRSNDALIPCVIVVADVRAQD
jgi:hypothetical protein